MPGYLEGYFDDDMAAALVAISDGALLYNNSGVLAGLAGSVDGSVASWDAGSSLFGDSSRAWAIATTSTVGVALVNTTAATAGAQQQYSPALKLGGTAWKTNATAESQTASWLIECRPAAGAAAVTSALHFLADINGGGFTSKMNLTSAGALTAAVQLISSTLQATTAASSINCASILYFDANSDRLTGLGNTTNILKYAGDFPLVLLHSARTDAASAVVFASVYDRNAASITNAATMRLHSFGWTNDSDAYTELYAVMADGCRIGGASKMLVAASATAVLGTHLGTGTAGTAAACAAITAGDGRYVQVETLSPDAIETSMANAIPAGAVIETVLGNVESALTGGGTTVTWSLGTTADPDKYGSAGYPTQADSLAKNSKSNWTGNEATGTSAETIVLTGCATGGAADGDTKLSVGSVKVMVIYRLYDAIPDAA